MATVRAGLWRSAEAVARFGEARGIAVGERRQTMMITAAADAGQLDLCAWFTLFFSPNCLERLLASGGKRCWPPRRLPPARWTHPKTAKP